MSGVMLAGGTRPGAGGPGRAGTVFAGADAVGAVNALMSFVPRPTFWPSTERPSAEPTVMRFTAPDDAGKTEDVERAGAVDGQSERVMRLDLDTPIVVMGEGAGAVEEEKARPMRLDFVTPPTSDGVDATGGAPLLMVEIDV